ncbi:MAG TPA: CstA-like transporter-associated (seleno)protein [Candidatus Acidoferrales bacterium]|nr:CstA-like transporter-associated (seleno)protein [Candidatus Acidoferrales bacterium]
MRKTKLETRNSKLGADWPWIGSLPLFAFRVSLFVFSRVWHWIRDVSGDNAYELYLQRQREEDAGDGLLSAEEFYRRRVERKYSRPSRCC